MSDSVILIVDDQPANLLALEHLLASENRILIHASTGKEALKISLKKDIDLIILDVQMPDMDGFEVAQLLKSNNKTKNIPIIFATAGSKERKFVIKGYDEGAVDYLIKPLDPEILKAKVSVLLKIQMQQKELVEKNLSLQKSALLINNSADIIGIIDASSFAIEEMNHAFTAVLGYAVEEIKNTTLSSFLEKEDKELLKNLTIPKKNSLTFEARMRHKDDSIKWLQWKVVIKDHKWFVNARDITEQKIAEKLINQLNDDLQKNVVQLEVSNKELESFSYSVSHDLRAPLRAISGFSAILEEDFAATLEEGAKVLLEKIKFSSNKMAMLIDDLLEFSRLGRKEIQRMNIDMESMVKSILSEIILLNNHTTIKINPLPSAEGDYSLLQQVWINLISNAIKYSGKKENPEIEIGTVVSDNETAYFVKDNGSGFDMNYAHKLFGVFQRLHSSTDFEGTGVGLAIAYRIITKHGGKIWATAKPNEGATFYFTVPGK